MKGAIKFIVITIAGLLVIIIAALACVPLWMPADSLKDMLAQQITKQTGRDAVIENLKFDIFKGIELKGVSIKETQRYKKRDFIKDDRMILKYNLFALFTGRLVIYKFELVSPYCEIIKEQDGKFNFSDILEFQAGLKDAKKNADEADNKIVKAKGTSAADKADGGSKLTFIKDIIVTSVSVRSGRFVYADYSKPQASGARIENFNFDMEDIVLSAVKPISVNMDCTAYYNEYRIPASLKAKIKADIQKRSAEISIEPCIIAGITTKGNVSLADLSDIKGSLNSFCTLKKVLEILPASVSKQMKGIDADMDISNIVDFSMTGKKLKFNDTLSLDNGTVVYNDKKAAEAVKGTIRMDDKYSLSGDLSMMLTGNEVKIKLSGSDIANTGSGKINVDIYSPKFAVEYLMAMFPKKTASTAKPETKKATEKKSDRTKKSGINSPGVYITLKADSIYYKDVTAGRTVSNIRFDKGKLYSETEINAYDGKINLNINADINAETYNIDALISRVKIDDFVDDAIAVMPRKKVNDTNLLDELKGKIKGKFDMKAKFTGDTFVNMDKTISGKGNFAVTGGRLTSVQMAENLGQLLKIDALKKDLPFDLIGCDFNMAAGKISTKNFRMYNGTDGKAGDIKVDGSGWVSVDNKLDFKIQMDFNPRVAKEIAGGITGLLNVRDVSYACDRDGWLPVDARIYNTVKEQKYDVSQPRITENIKRNMTKKIGDQGTKQLEEKAKSLIKNLFK